MHHASRREAATRLRAQESVFFWLVLSLTSSLAAGALDISRLMSVVETEQLVNELDRRSKGISTHDQLQTSDLIKELTKRAIEGEDKVLVLGDGLGSYAKDSIATYCKGKGTINKAVWGSKTEGLIEGQDGGAMAAAFKGNARISVSHVWLSVAADNWITSECNADTAVITADLKKIVANIRKYARPGVRIVTTGYCMPAGEPGGQKGTCWCWNFDKFGAPTPKRLAKHGCVKHAYLQTLQNAFRDLAADDPLISFVDVSCACGGGYNDLWSDSRLFRPNDLIHINDKGYCKMFTMNAVQRAFGCEKATYNCNTTAGRDPSTVCPLPPPPPPTPPPTPAPPINCTAWQCTCQGISELYGVDPTAGFGCATQSAQLWWNGHGCGTRSQKYSCRSVTEPSIVCHAPACKRLACYPKCSRQDVLHPE